MATAAAFNSTMAEAGEPYRLGLVTNELRGPGGATRWCLIDRTAERFDRPPQVYDFGAADQGTAVALAWRIIRRHRGD